MKLPPGSPPDSILLTFPVAREFAGQRLDRFIQSRIPRLSRTRAQEIVRSAARREDGTPRRASERVKAGEIVLLVRPRLNEPDVPLTFDVLHDDEWVLALDKPSGLPMHPTATYHNHTLTKLLSKRYGESPPNICHRLDRETSGIVLCARRSDAERALKLAFERRKVEKAYIAIVRGEMENDSGTIDYPLASVREGLHLLMEIRDDGDVSRALTHYRVLERRGGHSLVFLSPKTGRQHQLRVHLSAIGHPIVGDKLYGPEREAPFLEIIETGLTPEVVARLGHDRQALHAHRVVFEHPGSGESMTVESPIPADMRALWESYGPARGTSLRTVGEAATTGAP